jgi:hypothetical protein
MDLVGRRKALGLGVAAVLALQSSAVAAQQPAAIDGKVTQAGGGPLPNATVKVVSFDMPLGEVTLVTDGAGAFQLAPVPPGLYDIFVVAAGFQPGEWRDLRVKDGQTAHIEIAMARREGSAGY